MGVLGFGGKFWKGRDLWYVNCYREDETPERLAIIERTNEHLARARDQPPHKRPSEVAPRICCWRWWYFAMSERWPDFDEFTPNQQRAIGFFSIVMALTGCLVGCIFGFIVGWWIA